MEMKCKKCGSERQDGHTYCPYCGSKHDFTRSDFYIAMDLTKESFLEQCSTSQGIHPDIARSLGFSCWEYIDMKYGQLDRFCGRDMHEVIPIGALDALTLVRAKAEELFGLILEY